MTLLDVYVWLSEQAETLTWENVLLYAFAYATGVTLLIRWLDTQTHPEEEHERGEVRSTTEHPKTPPAGVAVARHNSTRTKHRSDRRTRLAGVLRRHTR